MFAVSAGIPKPMLNAADDQKLSALVERVAAMHRAWGPKASSSGTSLLLQEFSRVQAEGHTVVRYRVITSGLSSQKLYSLVVWPLDGQPTEVLAGIAINDKGEAVCPGRSRTCGNAGKPDDPIDLSVSGGLAEPKRFGLVSADQLTKVFVTVIPFPNQSTDRGCVLEETLLVGNSEAVIIRGSGFPPHSKLGIQVMVDGEKQERSAEIGEGGTYETILLPYKKGLPKGRTAVAFRTDSCAPSLSFDWGTSSYQLQ